MTSPQPLPGTSSVSQHSSDENNLILDMQVTQLLKLEAYWRWLCLGGAWITIGGWSLWELRESIGLLSEYLSLTGIFYSFYFHFWAGCCLITCLMLTCSTLLWQISHHFWGLTDKERHQLGVRVEKIQAMGVKHPLWRWIQVKP